MLFRKKKPVCLHKYKDFPWYSEIRSYCVDGSYTPRYKVVLMARYVCRHCGKRINLQLTEYVGFHSFTEAQNVEERLRKAYADKMEDILYKAIQGPNA